MSNSVHIHHYNITLLRAAPNLAILPSWHPRRRRRHSTPHLYTESATPYVIAYTTVPNNASATALMNAVLPAHLAACVNVIPGVRSAFWWRGAIHTQEELIVLMKTRRANVPAIESVVKQVSPYEVPAFVVLPIVAGGRQFLEWIGEVTKKDAQDTF